MAVEKRSVRVQGFWNGGLLAPRMEMNSNSALRPQAQVINRLSGLGPRRMPVTYRLEADRPLIHAILSTGVEFKIASHIFSKLFLNCE